MKLTTAQVLHRWKKTLKPSVKKGRFSEKEDALVRAAVGEFGVGNWTRVAARLDGRTDAQVRERWINVLDPKLLPRHVWSEEVSAPSLLRNTKMLKR